MTTDARTPREQIRASLIALKDVYGIAGSFVFARARLRGGARAAGHVRRPQRSPRRAAGWRCLQETFAAVGDQLDSAVLRFRDHQHLREAAVVRRAVHHHGGRRQHAGAAHGGQPGRAPHHAGAGADRRRSARRRRADVAPAPCPRRRGHAGAARDAAPPRSHPRLIRRTSPTVIRVALAASGLFVNGLDFLARESSVTTFQLLCVLACSSDLASCWRSPCITPLD